MQFTLPVHYCRISSVILIENHSFKTESTLQLLQNNTALEKDKMQKIILSFAISVERY